MSDEQTNNSRPADSFDEAQEVQQLLRKLSRDKNRVSAHLGLGMYVDRESDSKLLELKQLKAKSANKRPEQDA